MSRSIRTFPLSSALTSAAVVALLLAPVSAAVSPTVDAAAKKEGVVVWYTTMDDSTLAAVSKRFEQLHPGITVQSLRMGSSQLPARVVTEQRGGKFNADVISGDGFQLQQLVDAGALAPNPNPEAGKFVKGAVDPKGMWTSLYIDTTVVAWNPQSLRTDHLRAPTSLGDLTRPEWKGKIGVDSGAFNWYVGELQASPANAAVVRGIADNKPIITDGHTQTATQLEAGEFDATPTTYGYIAARDEKQGRAIAYLNPRPLLVTLNPIGLAKNAPHPDAARVLIDWLLSRDGQTFISRNAGGEQSARLDVPPDPNIWNAKIPFVVVSPPDPTHYNGLVQQFRTLFGIGT